MNARQLKVIFGALGVLVLTYAVVRFFAVDSGVPASGAGEISTVARNGFDLVRVLRPEPADSVRLSSTDGTWSVNGYPADSAQVRELAEGLDTARIGRLVARSASNHVRLGVSEDSATRIEIGAGGEPGVVFLLGKGGTDGRFVRFPPSDEVFTVPAASVRLLRLTVEEWRDRVVAAVDTSVVSRVAVRRNDQPDPVFLTRTTGDPAGWRVDGEAADTAAMQGLLRETALLTATGFPSDSVVFAVDFDNPVAVLEMFDSEAPGAAPALSLLFLTAPDAPEFLVRRADDPLAYRISAAQAERLLPTREMLLSGE